MPTIVDSLIVSLSIDPSQFKKGQEEANRAFAKVKDQAAKSGKEIEESNKKVGETFAKVRNEALGLFAAFLGARGIKEFVSDINTANASLGRFGINIGASPQLVSGWEKAVERMGGTAEEAAGSLDAISKALWQVHNMGQALPQELYRLQGGMGKIASTTFDSEHGVIPFMNDIAAQAQKLAAVDPVSAMNLLKGAGISEATANTMIKYGAGMGAYADSLGKSLGPTRDAIKGAQDLQDAWAKVRQTVDGIGNDSIPALDKALVPALGKMADFLQKFRDAEKATEGHSVPIPWGQWWQNTEKFFDIGAHGAELPPGFDEGAFESRRGQALSNLTFQGQGVSRGNPLPVDIVKTSLPQSGGDPNGFLGGPIGSGGPLPSGRGSGRGAQGALRSRGTGAYEGTAGDGDATSGSFMDALARIESANQNIHSRVDPDPPGYPGGNSQGYFQINTPTWREFAAGTRGAAYPDAMSAPRDVQAEVAERIPLSRFGPRTQRLLAIQFGALNTHDTIGALAAHFGGTVKPVAAKTSSSGGMSPAGGPWITLHGKRYQTDKNGNVLPNTGELSHHNAPAWWSGVPLAQNGAPTGGARLSSMAAGHAVTTSQTSNALHINGGIHVNAPNATDAHGIASELTASLERSTMAMLAQSGQV